MTKKGIIALIIFLFLAITVSVLFGAVFCLKNQSVKIIDGSTITVDDSEIISSAGLKKGQSIFMIDKNKAIDKIESKYPHLKVVQIKTTGITSIEICVRTRYEMYYTQANEKYYVFDEDLKVLEIIEDISSENEPKHLTRIEIGELEISTDTKVCDFVGTKKQRKIVYDLFVAMYTTVKNESGEFLTRNEVCALNKTISFEEFESFDKLIVETSYGVKLDIENPSSNLKNKINISFSTIEQFIEEKSEKEKSGIIRIYYDMNKEMKCVYIPESGSEE